MVNSASGLNWQFPNASYCEFLTKKRNVLSIGVAAIIWEFWKARNLACFEKKWLREPIDIIHCVVYWINY
jgi:hypothetical protein